MAAEYGEITESNQEDIAAWRDHILTDLHEALKMLRAQGLILDRHDKLLAEFKPLLDQFRTPAVSYMTRRAGRKNARQDPPQGQQIPDFTRWEAVREGHQQSQGQASGEPTPRD